MTAASRSLATALWRARLRAACPSDLHHQLGHDPDLPRASTHSISKRPRHCSTRWSSDIAYSRSGAGAKRRPVRRLRRRPQRQTGRPAAFPPTDTSTVAIPNDRSTSISCRLCQKRYHVCASNLFYCHPGLARPPGGPEIEGADLCDPASTRALLSFSENLHQK